MRITFSLMLLLPLPAWSATITADSASRSDVGAAVALAVDGDTVIVPAGSGHWTNSLTISNGITFQGAGTNFSTGTVIYDDVVDGGSLIILQTVSNKSYRVTGFHFPSASTRPLLAGVANVAVYGLSKAVRLDHMHFQQLTNRTRGITVQDACGVADHIVFYRLTRAIDFFMPNFQAAQVGTDRTDGTGSWSSPDWWGTTNAFVVEDCYFEGTSSTDAFTDAFNGAKYVVRHCLSTNGHFDSHEDFRPVRTVEIYANTMACTDDNGLILSLRGGSALVFSNTTYGSFPISVIAFNYRTGEQSPPWGQAYGTNVWDNHASSPAYSGTYTGTNGTTGYLVVTGAGWTPSQWKGYECLNTTPGKTNSWGTFGALINDNTEDLLIFNTNIPHPAALVVWTNGETFSIYYHTNTMDMPGVGQCSIVLTNDPPMPEMYPQNALNPIYTWNNTEGNIYAQANVRAGEHYFNNTTKPGYVPLVYPHPLIQATEGPFGATTRLSGNVRISKGVTLR